jgi:hypothetical protein
MKLCDPAMVYFGLACISILFGLMGSISARSLLAKGIYAIIWTFILNFLCDKGYKTLSWFLVILPFVVIFGMVALALDVARHSKTQTQTVNQPVNQPYQPPVYHPLLHR